MSKTLMRNFATPVRGGTSFPRGLLVSQRGFGPRVRRFDPYRGIHELVNHMGVI